MSMSTKPGVELIFFIALIEKIALMSNISKTVTDTKLDSTSDRKPTVSFSLV